MVKNKHILFYTTDSDGWIKNTMSFEVPDDTKTFADAVEHLKHTLRSPEVLYYVYKILTREELTISFVDVKWEDGELVWTFNGPNPFNTPNPFYKENKEEEWEDFDFCFQAEFITNFS